MRGVWWIFFVLISFPFVFAQQCTDGQQQVCGFNDVGECKLGTQFCQNGAWSQCFGAKWPSEEVCFDNKDNNCDNRTDENCLCQDGTERACGPNTNVGICEIGKETCQNNIWGACLGAVFPVFADLCNNAFDDDCDGTVDEGCQQQSSNVTSSHCFNQQKDGDELGIDCGGSCRACVGCNDGILNQGEQKISADLGNGTISDCGGNNCPPCPSCFDDILNQDETDIDCGGICRACEEEQEDDDDHDGLSEQQELLKGTHPFTFDTDSDGINDKVDPLPLCPNKRCDQTFGEHEENCPEDCKASKGGFVFGIIFLILFVVGAYLYWKFSKSKKNIRSFIKKKDELQQPSFDVQTYRTLEKKDKKTQVDDALEKSFKKAEEFLKK